MNLKEDLAYRLREIRTYFNYTQDKFAKELGINQRLLSKYETAYLELPDEIKYKLLQIGVSPDWLLTGEGEMFSSSMKNDDGLTVTQKPEFSLSHKETHLVNYNSVKIPILDIKASAGYGIEGIDNPNIVDYLDISKHLLGHYGQNVVCLEIKGDSMEPDFRSGDFVLCAVGVVEANGFYVININGNILFKRLQFIKQEKILIKSINPAYETEEIGLNEKGYFGIVGKVFRHIRSL